MTIKQLLIEERQQWFLWAPVLYGTGIAGYFSLAKEPPLAWGLMALILVMFVMVLFRKQFFWRLFLIALMVIVLGFLAVQWRTLSMAAPVLTKATRPLMVTGKMTVMTTQSRGKRIIIASPKIDSFAAKETPKKLRLAVNTAIGKAVPGDRIEVLAVLKPPQRPVYPGAYDFSRIAYFQQIGATGYTLSPLTVIEPAEAITARAFFNTLRTKIVAKIMAVLEKDAGGVAAALSVGEKGAVPKNIYQNIRISGLAHLLAISGLHLTLVVGVCFFLCRSTLSCSQRLALHYPIKKLAALFALGGSLFYLAIAGFPIPATRSFIMAGFVLVAILLDRTPTPMRCVAFAAMGILIFEPESLLRPGFQMSFSAVIALIACYQWLVTRHKRDQAEPFHTSWKKKFFLYFMGIIISSLIAGIATAPFSLFHFNQYASYSVLANLLAIPITSFWIMPWIVIFFLFYPLGLATLALIPMGWGIDAVLAIAEKIVSLPFAIDAVPTIPMTSFTLLVLGGCWLCLWTKYWRLYGILPIILGLCLCLLMTSPDIIIEEEGKLFAVKDSQGRLLVSSKRQAKFARQIWEQRLGKTTSEVIGSQTNPSLRCDSFGCHYRNNHKTTAIIHHPLALQEACMQVDYVINLTDITLPCRRPAVYLSKWQLRQNGTHTLYFHNNGVDLDHVRASQGDRPWVR